MEVRQAFSFEDEEDFALGGPEDRIVCWRIG